MDRRDFLKTLGVGSVGGIAGAVAYDSIKALKNALAYPSFSPNFQVIVFSEEFAKGLNLKGYSDQEKFYINHERAYTKIQPPLVHHASMRIYQDSHFELQRDDCTRYVTNRKTGEEKFVFVLSSPETNGEIEFKKNPVFLSDDELLQRVVDGEEWYKGDRPRGLFDNYNSDVAGHMGREADIPQHCSFRLKEDNVSYDIFGLEALLDNDKKLLEFFWNNRIDFKNIKKLKNQYQNLRSFVKSVEKP